MTFEATPITGKGDIRKGLTLKELLKHGEHVGLVLGPSEREDLGEWVHAGDGQLWQQTEKKNEIRKKILLALDMKYFIY